MGKGEMMYIDASKANKPLLVRKHVDGPYVITNGQIRWLGAGERIALWFGVMPKERRHHD